MSECECVSVPYFTYLNIFFPVWNTALLVDLIGYLYCAIIWGAYRLDSPAFLVG